MKTLSYFKRIFIGIIIVLSIFLFSTCSNPDDNNDNNKKPEPPKIPIRYTGANQQIELYYIHELSNARVKFTENSALVKGYYSDSIHTYEYKGYSEELNKTILHFKSNTNYECFFEFDQYDSPKAALFPCFRPNQLLNGNWVESQWDSPEF
jgi:hypothetical protein